MERSLESNLEAFLKHAESLHNDYEATSSFLMVNLLAQATPHEDLLTTNLRKLINDSALVMEKRTGKRIDYDYFDFHQNLKKSGGTALMDSYINEQLKVMYLGNIGVYQEKTSESFNGTEM
jgi:hypothetical protein